MMSALREKSTITAQNSAIPALRLRAIIRRFGLSQAELAAVMRMPVRTLQRWLAGETEPPALALALLDVIERSSESRRILGVHVKPRSAPRGRPFRRGNEFRFNDRRRRALQRASARLPQLGMARYTLERATFNSRAMAEGFIPASLRAATRLRSMTGSRPLYLRRPVFALTSLLS